MIARICGCDCDPVVWVHRDEVEFPSLDHVEHDGWCHLTTHKPKVAR